MKKVMIQNLEEFEAVVQTMTADLGEKRLVLLSGPMGAGKTQWVKSYLRSHGLESETASPSFALHHSYNSTIGLIDHVDLFRLESMEDLESTGFWDLFDKDQGVIIVEWADRVPLDYYPPNWPQLRVQIEKDSALESVRQVTFSFVS